MNFIKSTLLGGLFVLLPLVLLWLGLAEIVSALIAMATPIADIFPVGTFDELNAPGIVAAALIVSASFLLGLAARSPLIARIGRNFEAAVLFKVPLYKMLKIMSAALIDSDKSEVCPALYVDGNGAANPCYLIEKHANGRATVLMPWSPTSFAGSVMIVQQADLRLLDCSLDDFSRALAHMGVGVEECISRKPSS